MKGKRWETLSVSELIAKLQQFDPSLPVLIEGWDSLEDVLGIETIKHEEKPFVLITNHGHG